MLDPKKFELLGTVKLFVQTITHDFKNDEEIVYVFAKCLFDY